MCTLRKPKCTTFQFKMLLWPKRWEIFNHAFRSIKTGTDNVFDRNEFKKGAIVLKINPFALMTQYTVFTLMATKRTFWALQLNVC